MYISVNIHYAYIPSSDTSHAAIREPQQATWNTNFFCSFTFLIMTRQYISSGKTKRTFGCKFEPEIWAFLEHQRPPCLTNVSKHYFSAIKCEISPSDHLSISETESESSRPQDVKSWSFIRKTNMKKNAKLPYQQKHTNKRNGFC